MAKAKPAANTETTVTDGPMPEIRETPVVKTKTRAEIQQEIDDLKAQLAGEEDALEVAPLEERKAPEHNGEPIPKDYVDIVNQQLNPSFRIEMEYSSNSPFFGFSILVPQTYSNAPKPHWDMYGEDRRTRMISNAEGLNGVKAWVERVYNNFDPETKARISSDRALQHG